MSVLSNCVNCKLYFVVPCKLYSMSIHLLNINRKIISICNKTMEAMICLQ